MGGNATADLQTDAAQGFPQTAKAKMCRSLTKQGLPCTMPPIHGTDLCMAHTPGLTVVSGRRGGLNRRHKPKAPPRCSPWSPPKGAPGRSPFVLPDVPLDSAEHIAEVSAAAIAAVAAGTMDPRQGTALSQMLERHRKVIETVGYAKRLAAIEAAVGAKGDVK